jgi:peptidylprolyl isomerase
MLMAIFGDFILISYEIRDENGNLYEKSGDKGRLIVYGLTNVLEGIEKEIGTMKENEEIEKTLSADEAYGKKNPSLIRTFPLAVFGNVHISEEQEIKIPTEFGTELKGVVKKVNAGRVTIDFNHPLAEKPVVVKLKVLKIIKNEQDKIKAFFETEGFEVIEVNEKDSEVWIKKPEDETMEEKLKLLQEIDAKILFPPYKIRVERA